MALKNRKIKKRLLLLLIALIIAGFFMNWFLTHRLEKILRDEISSRVSEATNGFYKLSYDKLSVGLFSGELKIDGLVLYPDTLVFDKLAEKDSLPDVYFHIHIDTVDFKGINLTWRFNYRKLHFDLFEIQSPKIDIYSPYGSDTTGDAAPRVMHGQNLYEMVSPFFDVVTVKYLNLQNAEVSYTVANEKTPAVYALRDASFHAFGFRLDENSSTNGKLLYCDNFDFTTNMPQRLFQDNRMILNAAKIALKTQDSVMRITGIELLPQKQLWAAAGSYPPDFLEAKIDSVEMNGVAFKRENAKSILNARTFIISNSDIAYFKIDTISPKAKSNFKPGRHGAAKEWSLYTIMSPVLNSTSVNRINLNETTLKYVQVTDKGKDEYFLDNFNFWAQNFLVDAETSLNPSLLYSGSFGFEADSLVGNMQSRNHNISVDKIFLDTDKGILNINNIKIAPIATTYKYDYISGSIDSVNITGLKTGKGLEAERLLIKSPDIIYTRNGSKTEVKKNRTEDSDIEEIDMPAQTSIDMLASITEHYYIKDIELKDADIAYKNPNKKNSIFKVNNLNFFARDFLVDDYTRKNIDWYFDCSDFGFYLKNFDNYIDGGMYRLSAKNIIFTGMDGKFSMSDIKLLPQDKTWDKAPDVYFMAILPLLEARGFDFKNKTARLNVLDMKSPRIWVTKERESVRKDKSTVKKKVSFSLDALDNIEAGVVSADNLKLEYVDKPNGSHLVTGLKELDIKNISWSLSGSEGININEILLKKPLIGYTVLSDRIRQDAVGAGEKPETGKPSLLEAININKLKISDILLNADIKGNKATLGMEGFSLKKLRWKMNGDNPAFGLSEAVLSNPLVSISVKYQPDDTVKDEVSISKKDIYKVLQNLSPEISIDKFNLNNANIDYVYSGRNIENKSQKLNNINLWLEGLNIDNANRKIKMRDITFSTEDLNLPVDNGFYTLGIEKINLSKKGERLLLDNIRLKSHYPKMEFAYRHPNHKDWFDVAIGSFTAKGIDIPEYFSDSVLVIDEVQVSDVVLKNFKNQKIITPRRISPMIYEGIQKLPVKFDVKKMDVLNFYVEYEELAAKGDIPGKIFFTEMNGYFSGFTNIVNAPQQYIELDADGRLMGTGRFTATWKIPVDSLNDRFILRANLDDFDLSDLNRLLKPLANADVTKGIALNTQFNIDASSKGGHIGMLFLYNDLKVNVMKKKEGELADNKLITRLANLIIRNNNPNNIKSTPRSVDIYVERNPYHSTFNYFWQMLQPALAESVGISHSTLGFFKSIPLAPGKLRNFFWKEGSYDRQKKEK